MRGHVLANLDPLEKEPGYNPELDLAYYGLSVWDLDREFYCGGLGSKRQATLRVIIKLLRDTYCEQIGADYMHLLDLEERKWLRERMESSLNEAILTIDDKKQILSKLNQAMALKNSSTKNILGINVFH